MSKFAESFRRAAFSGIAAATICVSTSVASANQPPIAEDDVIITQSNRLPVTITTLLDNDIDPEGGDLSIVGLEQGVGGTVSVDPSKPQQVVFKPNGSFTGIYTFMYEIADPQGRRSSAIATVRNPFRQAEGVYAGAISGAAGVPNSSGYVNLTLTSTGAFTGKLQFGGDLLRFVGVFELDGTFSVDVQLSKKERRRLQLTLPVDGSGAPVQGVYSGGNQTISLSLPRMTFTRKNPPPFSGSFNVAFLPPDAKTTTPAGTGYGILRLSDSGNVTFKGKLGDATPVSFSGFVNPDGTASVYSVLYKGRGSVAGHFAFEEDGFVRVSGDATWFKPRIRGDSRYPAGFSKALQADGSLYTPPAPNARPLEFLSLVSSVSNAALLFEKGGFGKGATLKVDVPPRPGTGRYEITPPRPNRRKLSLRIDAQTGFFVGSVREPVSNKPRRVSGVLLQGHNLGVGVFEGKKKTGAVTLTPDSKVN